MSKIIAIILIVAITLIGISFSNSSMEKKEIPTQEDNLEIATLAGGCFWCVESAYEHYEGVIEAVSGYTGGHKEDPTYQEVTSGTTGHYEAVQITFDPSIISFKDLLEIFWRQIDPTDAEGSFVDKGPQYRSAIFYHDEEQKKIAEQSKKDLEESGKYEKPIVTEILPAEKFYKAEEYHQDYYKKSSGSYESYRKGSGRDQYREETWGDDKDYDPTTFTKPSDEELKSTLNPIQYKVTQEDGTEKPFNNEYWDNKEEGIYVDLISGEPLFSSTDKYESGTGWPSFTKPIDMSNVVEKEDNTLLSKRTEIRSKIGDSHLGHVFDDGPEDAGGQRFCMNSAALKFIPKDKMEEEGYGDYLYLFE